MRNFRPNLTMSGSDLAPFAEDAWGSIRVGAGGVDFGVVKPCARCKIPTVDQSTGVPDGAGAGIKDDDEGGGPQGEPIATLRTFRTGKLLGYKSKKKHHDVFFGQNLVVNSPVGSVVSVGDAVVPVARPWYSRGVHGVHYVWA